MKWSDSHSAVSASLRLHGLSTEFSRQQYWSGLPFPSPGHLPDPGTEPESPALQADSLPLRHQGSPRSLKNVTVLGYKSKQNKTLRNYFHLVSLLFLTFFSFIFISWRLITLQHCSGFCHTLTWISHGYTCIPHPDPRSHLPLHSIPLGLLSAPGPSTCLMHPTWAGDLFHPR